MKKLELNNGQYTVVDEKDYILLRKYNWTLGKDGYAVRTIYILGHGKNRKRTSLRLHNFLMPKKKGFIVDHINRNRLDNRRLNLRYVNYIINARNKNMQSNNTSGYTGVTWHKMSKKWLANIWVNKKYVYLGTFENIKDAIYKRKLAEKKYF
jgi:hypothetical protein